MEGIRHRATVGETKKRLGVPLLFTMLLLLIPGTALADLRDTTATANSNQNGVDFTIREVTHDVALSGTRKSGVRCTYEPQFGNIGYTSGYWKRAPSPTSVLGHRTCTDGTDDFIWVDACDFVTLEECPDPTPRVDPEVLAREARDHLPVPGIRISANPGRGLVGVRSWFWLEGAGQPLTGSLARFGVRVDVEARPVRFEWDFGDGTVKTTRSPGQPYPQRPAVTHVYERSSAAYEQGYHVVVTTVFDVRWRTNRGRWRTLPGISRTSERFYPVAESQAVNSDG